MNKELKRLSLGSILAAVAIVFGLVVKYIPGLNIQMPQGGAIFGIYMLPIVLSGLILGPLYGGLTGLIYGIISWMLDGYYIHWGSIFFDYMFAFSSMGIVAGFFVGGIKNYRKVILAFLIAGTLRWIFHGLSGVIFFKEYANHPNVWFYSFILYNAPYCLSSMGISLALGLILGPKLEPLTDEFMNKKRA